MKLPMIIFKLLFLGALFISSNYNLHLADTGERELFLDLYYTWLGNLVDQGIDVTGYVVKFEWLPESNITYPEG